MDLEAVMTDLESAVDTISGLRPHVAADGIRPPTALVALPDQIKFDGTGARGMDEITIPILVLVARMPRRTATAALQAYASGSGAESVKAAVDTFAATAYDVARVRRAKFEAVTLGGADYLAAVFNVDVFGTGT